MAQQRIVGAIAQSEADFADAAGGRWPDRRLTVQLGQPFVIGRSTPRFTSALNSVLSRFIAILLSLKNEGNRHEG